MALFAAAGYLAGVRGMALNALRDGAVNFMTAGAVKSCMPAFISQDLFLLQGMAFSTGAFTLECDGQGRMRIPVAVQASCVFEMRLPFLRMAFAAKCDRLFHFRWMSEMTSYTGNIPVPTA